MANFKPVSKKLRTQLLNYLRYMV